MSNKNPYVDMAIKLATNPWVLAAAGGVAGYYLFGREDGKTKKGKTPYIAGAVGAGVGLAAGKMIQSMRAAGQQTVLPPGVTPEMIAAHQGPEAVADDYYSVGDVDQVFGQGAPAGAPNQPTIDPLAGIQSDIEQPMGFGTLDGTSLGSNNGFGSLAQDEGFSAYDPSVDDAFDDVNGNN